MSSPTAPAPAELLPMKLIRPAPDNIREDVGDVRSLANSIRENGLLTPIVVAIDSAGYIIIAGHRRRAAMAKLGWTHAPCVVRRPMSDQDRTVLMLIENTQRVNIDPIEKALALKRLVDGGKSQAQVARELGIDPNQVSSSLKLLTLDEERQARIRSGKLSVRQALVYARAEARANGERRGAPRKVLTYSTELEGVDDEGQAGKTVLCDKCGGSGEIRIQNHPHPECVNCTPKRLCFKHARERAEADMLAMAKLKREAGLL